MHPEDIDASLLLKLDALLRERNVSNAARRMGLTQSAMSHALGRIREQLGDPLLVRTGREMVLTPRAEAIAPRVARLVRELVEIWSATREHEPAPLPGLFAISAGEALQIMLVPGVAAILQREAAQADLVVLPTGGDTIELLRCGASDLALGAFGALPPDIHQQTLITDKLVCLVRAEHPVVTSGLTLTAYTTFAHVQVGGQESVEDLVETRLTKQGYTRRICCMVTSYWAALALVAQSNAILTVPHLLAQRLAPSHALVILPPPVRLAPWRLSMAWHAHARDQDAGAWLRQVVLRATKHLTEPMEPEATDEATDTNDERSSSNPGIRPQQMAKGNGNDDCIE